MEEKIKVNVSLQVNDILEKDMELFEFYKKDNLTLNKNLFYITLIINYYETFQELESKKIQTIEKYMLDNTNMNAKEISLFSIELASKLGNNLTSMDAEYYDKALSIKPTVASASVFAYINQYHLKASSLSNYYRALFSSYTRLPQDLRERIIFKKQFDVISQAIQEERKIFIVRTNDKAYEVSPYMISKSKEELFNYVLSIHDQNNPFTLRLTRIKSVSLLNEKSHFNETQKELLDWMNFVGPQYDIHSLEKDHTFVRLTERGKQHFKQFYVNRPKPLEINDDTYEFNCSYNQIHQYFRRFGKEATILSPKPLQESMMKYYKTGYYHYKNFMDRSSVSKSHELDVLDNHL